MTRYGTTWPAHSYNPEYTLPMLCCFAPSPIDIKLSGSGSRLGSAPISGWAVRQDREIEVHEGQFLKNFLELSQSFQLVYGAPRLANIHGRIPLNVYHYYFYIYWACTKGFERTLASYNRGRTQIRFKGINGVRARQRSSRSLPPARMYCDNTSGSMHPKSGTRTIPFYSRLPDSYRNLCNTIRIVGDNVERPQAHGQVNGSPPGEHVIFVLPH